MLLNSYPDDLVVAILIIVLFEEYIFPGKFRVAVKHLLHIFLSKIAESRAEPLPQKGLHLLLFLQANHQSVSLVEHVTK